MCDIRNMGQAAAWAFPKTVPSNRDKGKLKTSGIKRRGHKLTEKDVTRVSRRISRHKQGLCVCNKYANTLFDLTKAKTSSQAGAERVAVLPLTDTWPRNTRCPDGEMECVTESFIESSVCTKTG